MELKMERQNLSGIVDQINKDRISKHKNKIIKSEVISINHFLKEENIKKINILSLDIEGKEEEILREIDFDRIFIDTICVEDGENEKKVDKVLEKNNFILIYHGGFDKIFINRKSNFYKKGLFIYRIKAKIINKIYGRNLRVFFRQKLNKFPHIKNKIKKILGTETIK